MPTNTQVSSDIDTLLRLPSKVAVQDYLGVDDNATGVAANAAAILLKAPIDDATFTGTTTIPSADITTADFNAGEYWWRVKLEQSRKDTEPCYWSGHNYSGWSRAGDCMLETNLGNNTQWKCCHQ